MTKYKNEEFESTFMTCLLSDGLTKLESPPEHSMPMTLEKLVAEETPYSPLSAPSLAPSVQERRGETRDVSWPHSDLRCDRMSLWESSQKSFRLPR